MFSEKFRQYASQCWQNARPGLGRLGDRLEASLKEYTGWERSLLELALGTLPASDVAGVPLEVLAAYGRHALYLRERSPFCAEIPEDIFLHHVYYPRINSEDLVDCREFFYKMVQPQVEGLGGTDAALAVNRWCAAQMTYETTDGRSINPITAYRCGLGRCGEESTFAVTALRSVGIPARQIYTPWWSHCDDNHAWVEVYVDGDWHFLGACEPEPFLDKGWFSSASSRAMLVCSRSFFDFVGEGLAGEALTQVSGSFRMYNQTHRYAETAPITVTVTDEAGAPLTGALVRFYVLNMANTARIAALETDENGQVRLEAGLGSCLVEAEDHGHFAWAMATPDSSRRCTLIPTETAPAPEHWDWDFIAPAASAKNNRPLTPAQAREKAETLALAKERRRTRLATYWKPEFATGDTELDLRLESAGEHAAALSAFCRAYGEDGRALLRSLSKKDCRDADVEVLKAHLEACRALPGREKPAFVPYVQCPRIGLELLSDWRRPILRALTEREKSDFAEDPSRLWREIQARFLPEGCHWQPVLWLRPEAALALGAADRKGQRLLFVAILRTLGIPARLNPVDGKAQYLLNGRFVTPEEDAPTGDMGTLTLTFPKPLVYGQSWTLSRWEQGWQALDLADCHGPQYHLPQGLYRLITTNRLPNGNQLASFRIFRLEDAAALTVACREASPEEMLARYPVVPPVRREGLQLQLYLEVSAEPTEHSLNELLENLSQVRAAMEKGLRLLLILPDRKALEDPTLKRVLSLLPQGEVVTTDFSDAALEALARALYVEPGLWPLTLLTNGNTAYYGHAGYTVGSIPLALGLVEQITL